MSSRAKTSLSLASRWLLLIYVLFVLYNTLLPFDFVLRRDFARQNWEQISWSPFFDQMGRRVSRTDIAGNVLLFLPFGFLAWGAWPRPSRGRGALITITGAGAALSMTIEGLQLFLVHRHTGLHDVISNTAGTLLGVTMGWLYWEKLAPHLDQMVRTGLRQQPMLVVVALFLLLHTLGAAMPFNVTLTVSDLKQAIKTLNIAPLGSQALIPGNPTAPFSSIDFVEALLFFAILGLLLEFCARNYGETRTYRMLVTVILPLLYFPLVEIGQMFVRSRVSDINDILAGWLGTFGGIWIAHFLATGQAAPRRLPHRSEVYTGLLLYLGFLCLANLKPFDFTLNRLSSPLPLRNLVPFYAYFRVTRLWNLYDLLVTISYGIPLGFLWALRQYRRSGNGTAAGAIVIPLLLGLLFESAQYFSPSRSADLTDVLSYGLGGYLGLWLFQQYGTGIFVIQPYRPRRTYGVTQSMETE
ncbi:MAG: VanZ family protein [Nitrospinota bacterium]|nr:MAG: VanZ family protein [Nitrospinota bacterium]